MTPMTPMLLAIHRPIHPLPFGAAEGDRGHRGHGTGSAAGVNTGMRWDWVGNVPQCKPCRSARPGDSGRTGSLRSSAWIAVFSSTQNTAACAGGLTYSPMMSAALRSKSGSFEAM
jgi:hypothetical protein